MTGPQTGVSGPRPVSDGARPPDDAPACDYCGLPVAVARPGPGPLYCCHGCRLAASITGATGEDGEIRWMMTRLGLAIFFSMNVMVFTMLLWSQPDAAPSALAAALYDLARHACLLFTAPVIILLGGPLLTDSLDELSRGRPSLSLLLLTGVSAAFVQSAWATWTGVGHVSFEICCMVLVAVMLGRWLEASGRLRTTAALRELRTLIPDRVRRVRAGAEEEIDIAAVARGDVLRVLPGDRIPTDGLISRGAAAIDERTVTGESVPAEKHAGDVVYSGTCDLDGDLLVTVTAPPGTGTLEQLIATVLAATGGGRQQRLAEIVAAVFLPSVLAVAVGACWFHWRTTGPAAGILAGLAVVVVSCPCALGLATPMALWAATGAATRRHVLIRDSDAFTGLAAADAWCFDKTGTLTSGCRVTAIETRGGEQDPRRVLGLAAALASGSPHAFAAAIIAAAREQGIPGGGGVEPLSSRTVAGRGVEAVLADGRTARLGSAAWIIGAEAADDAAQCIVAIDGEPIGGIRLAEAVRPEAAATLAALRADGGRTIMLSGDRAARARPVAVPLGLECRAPLLPAEKLVEIEALRREGRRVAMVGDGINDAPALAAADVGIALGCGADVSRWSADVCLLQDDLSTLPWLVDLARRTCRTVRWNLLWAFGYNAACIPLAASGWVHPALAAAAMVASSLLVVTNSLRLAAPETP